MSILSILKQDIWPENTLVISGVRRQMICSYTVATEEAVSSLIFSTDYDPYQASDRVIPEMALISDEKLEHEVAKMVEASTMDRDPIAITPGQLSSATASMRLICLLCHPRVVLPSDCTAEVVRHEAFPYDEGQHSAIIFGCAPDAGVLAQTGSGHRGVILRPQKFFKLRLEEQYLSPWDRLMREDVLEDT